MHNDHMRPHVNSSAIIIMTNSTSMFQGRPEESIHMRVFSRAFRVCPNVYTINTKAIP
jgi:hypothetical protein